MRFSKVKAVRIPKGSAKKIRHDGKVLWSPILARYVSLGDSIAAGHTINDDWEKDYGYDSQYGANGNTETAIVPNSYTDLIHRDLVERMGGTVNTTSFARSGDTVADLIDKLNHTVVRDAISKADYVTICIGANDVLEPAMRHLEEYINAGDSALQQIASIVEANLARLADDSNANSYTALFNKLKAINPTAKYVFTTIYNPYKYLWIEEGHHGFFKPLMDAIPTMEFAGIDFDSFIKDSLLGVPIVQQLFDRVNGLDSWAEHYVTRLNNVLRSKISAFANANFILADTKAVFDPVPDRPITDAPKHYNDLVNVEYTRDYDTAQMDWGRLWEGSNVVDFWWGLANKHGLNIEAIASDLIPQIAEKVVVPDVDPHPETFGHYVLKRAFADALGLQPLEYHSITYNANGGSGTMETQVIPTVDGLPVYITLRPNAFTYPTEGYRVVGWNSAPDGSGYSYTPSMYVGIVGMNTLYAQWSNIYAVNYKHSNHTDGMYGNDETGHMECYNLYINGELMPKLGKFSENNSPTYYLPYGTTIKVAVSNYNPSEITYDDATCDVYLNGANVASGYRGTEYTFALTRNTAIDFRWKIAGSLATFNAKSWEDCYITTD